MSTPQWARDRAAAICRIHKVEWSDFIGRSPSQELRQIRLIVAWILTHEPGPDGYSVSISQAADAMGRKGTELVVTANRAIDSARRANPQSEDQEDLTNALDWTLEQLPKLCQKDPPPTWMLRRKDWLVKRLCIDWDQLDGPYRNPSLTFQRSVFWAVMREWRPEGFPRPSYPTLTQLRRSASGHSTVLKSATSGANGAAEMIARVMAELPKDIDA